MDLSSISQLIQQKKYHEVKLMVQLGFDLSIADVNFDRLNQFGHARPQALDAAITGDITKLSRYSDAALTQSNDQGYMPLHWALINHQHQSTALILERTQMDPHYKTNEGNNLLHIASRFNNEIGASMLLKYNSALIPRLYERNDYGFNCLHFACNHNNQNMIHLIFQATTNTKLFAGNRYHATPLHWLAHGQKCAVDIKHQQFLWFEQQLKQAGQIHNFQQMLTQENALGFTPSDWLQRYECYNTLHYLEKLYL